MSYHNIDENNWFFQKLFRSNNETLLKICIRYNEFLVTEKQKVVHNFLKHYDEGKNIPFEEEPLHIVRYPGRYITLNLKNAVFFIIFMILKNVSMTF